MKYLAFILIITFSVPMYAWGAATEETDRDSLVAVTLKDGTKLQGTVIAESQESVTVRTIGGIEVTAPRSSIVSTEPIRGDVVGGEYRRFDPNYSRLIYMPTGRPMRQGEGNFSVHMIFLPAITYAFTDNFSILAGMSLIPDASSQLKYIAPKIGTSLSDNAAVSVGTMYLTVSGDEGGGFVFGSTTLGPRDRSFSASIAVPYATEGGFADGAIVTLGGNVRMSNSASFITENWLLFGEGESEQLFSAGIRWFGDRIAVDFVAIIVPDADKPFPWLSFTYNFGR